MDTGRGKRVTIYLSSSSEEENDDDCEEEEDEEEDDDDDEYNDSDKVSESDDSDIDDESLSNKVVTILQEGNDLDSLKLNECKAYLRKHSLRLAGNRAVCIGRVKEHWGLKYGSGYTLYPKSSFIIDCTGDVCMGDVVLFRQKVYEKYSLVNSNYLVVPNYSFTSQVIYFTRFDKVTRRGRVIGNRTVAGRVVKESYGAAKQQHTFTVEVLWSSGVRKLPPLSPLLVKGRNLYKQKTYRQRWKNEGDRVKVLSEKHNRGAAARFVRALKQKRKSRYANESNGSKRRHEIHSTKRSKIDKVRHLDGSRRANNYLSQEATSSTHATWKESTSSRRAFRSPRGRHHKSAEFDHYQDPIYPSHVSGNHRMPYQCQVNSQSRNEPSSSFFYERGPIPKMTGVPPFRPRVSEFTSRTRHLASSDHHHARTNHMDRPLQLSPRARYGWR